MVNLYLDGKEVFFDNKKAVKVTKENPYFTQSGSYTLDVDIPMSIYQNALFFKHLNRLEVRKRPVRMSAVLVADNHPLLTGSAIINSITDKIVKLQLVGGNSDINYSARFEGVYIDEIDYGELSSIPGMTKLSFIGNRNGGPYVGLSEIVGYWDAYNKAHIGVDGEYVLSPVFDETNEKVKNVTELLAPESAGSNPTVYTSGICVQPNLQFVIKKVIEHFGYKAVVNDFDATPWNKLYICNARRTLNINEMLPHWNVIDFLKEVQNFFNCTIVFDEEGNTCSLISNRRYFDVTSVSYNVLDEYSVDVAEDGDDNTKSLGSSNIRYDVSDSESHIYDILSDEVLEGYEHKSYSSYNALVTAVNAMSDTDKKKYIFECPTGHYVWASDTVSSETVVMDGGHFGGSSSGSSSSTSPGSGTWSLKPVNQFGAILRNQESDSYIDLKICPVGMTDKQTAGYYVRDTTSGNHGNVYSLSWELPVQMPSMANPKGDIIVRGLTDCVWSGITGTQEISSNDSAEDRIQVAFAGSLIQYINKPGVADASKKLPFPMMFTDHLDKAVNLTDCNYLNVHESWSLALDHSSAEYYLGQLHNNAYSINTQSEIMIDFECPTPISANHIFVFRNKRYVCKKIEYSVTYRGVNPVARGYFYELL